MEWLGLEVAPVAEDFHLILIAWSEVSSDRHILVSVFAFIALTIGVGSQVFLINTLADQVAAENTAPMCGTGLGFFGLLLFVAGVTQELERASHVGLSGDFSGNLGSVFDLYRFGMWQSLSAYLSPWGWRSFPAQI